MKEEANDFCLYTHAHSMHSYCVRSCIQRGRVGGVARDGGIRFGELAMNCLVNANSVLGRPPNAS